jgi:hypothetical protein
MSIPLVKFLCAYFYIRLPVLTSYKKYFKISLKSWGYFIYLTPISRGRDNITKQLYPLTAKAMGYTMALSIQEKSGIFLGTRTEVDG